MHAKALEISWHDATSVWSIDCAHSLGSTRLVTAGGDKTARVWRLRATATPQPEVEWVCDLKAHTSTVNVARFAPGGGLIATAADGGEIALWARAEASPPGEPKAPAATGTSGSAPGPAGPAPNTGPAFGGPVDAEKWSCVRTLRGHTHDVLDLSWARDGSRLASASVDKSVMIWDVGTPDRPPASARTHSNFVQGVAFHPSGGLIASLGADRFLRVVVKSPTPAGKNSKNAEEVWQAYASAGSCPKGEHRLFVDDMKSKNVFRRLAWSPDGNLLACPSGVAAPGGGKKGFAVHVFARMELRKPVLQCAGLSCPAVAVRFCPVLFERRKAGATKEDEVMRPVTLTDSRPEVASTQGASGLPDSGNAMDVSVPTGATTSSDLPLSSPPPAAVPASEPPSSKPAPSPSPPPEVGPQPPGDPLAALPYRMLFAVATSDALLLYDTESLTRPIAHVSGLHLAEQTDLAWAPDGRHLFVSSTDGYVSVVSFADGELGTPLAEVALPPILRATEAPASAPAVKIAPVAAAPTLVAPRRVATTQAQTNGTAAQPASSTPVSAANTLPVNLVPVARAKPAAVEPKLSAALNPETIAPPVVSMVVTPAQPAGVTPAPNSVPNVSAADA